MRASPTHRPRSAERALGPLGPWITRWAPPRPVAAVAIVLHGGQVTGLMSTEQSQLAVRRMDPFASALARAHGDRGLAVWRVRNRVRGWNGDGRSSLEDAGRAVDEVRRRLGGVPVVLVGHSMGGRVALRSGGVPGVRGVAALAPWIPEGEPVEQLVGRRVLLAHGSRDLTTSPRASADHTARIARVAESAEFVRVPLDVHAMLRWRTWNRLVTEFAGTVLDACARESRG
ncbi:alpha/beta fold hydrolase [Nocardiopsis akebiae]|uniref:Alpha/beta fold hydrolase n=1 Tax=Nocardiopsis akebiae TaxID=2831968 RepID=A0ABX8C523_9ACTN|nr:alpha/beta fold hydrolase [Nocardiopsis akebiae]QUX29217.1 alpha/beta fold hydrolase [Nocardiopsis akebiae]